jgi:hypothetical protein
MRRRNSLFSLLFFLVIAIAAFYILQEIKVPQESAPPRSSNAPERYEHRTYPESRNRHGRPEEAPASCDALGIECSSAYFEDWQEPANGSCNATIRNGYPVPDPRCTPGGVNPSVGAQVLQNPGWRTRCIRDCEESQAAKHAVYRWYQIPAPEHNSGANQVCELDHLVPLELGGADGLGNIWPECGPDGAALDDRYFKIKDRVENYLADEVKAGRIPLEEAQRGIASDWTQYLDRANRYCASGGRC